jgi:predicted DNA-binding transcriptional regulator YafY
MRADRLLSIVMLLQTRGKMTAGQLAAELEVSRRTILRDVEALSVAGIPLYTDGGHGGGIALDEHYRLTLTGLNESEVRALFISGSAKLLKDVGLGEAAESTLLKLFAALPAPHQPSVDQIRQRILIDPLWWWHDTQPLPFWAELQRAVYEDRCIHARYENSSGAITEREMEPYSLVAKASLWYLVARREGELRTYRISRFHAVTVLDKHFQRPPDFDLAAYWQTQARAFIASASEYVFTLRLHHSRLGFTRYFTPGRWRILDGTENDEWLVVRFQVENREQAKMLVFGLGKQAVVLQPDDLREALLNGARELIEYNGQ